MADYLPLPGNDDDLAQPQFPNNGLTPSRVASLDAFRGLCVFLMMLVDYGGSLFPIISHSPWDGLRLADFVMPFFLFISGVSLALVHKKVSNKPGATWKAVLRAAKLFFLGVLLQGGYLHGVSDLTYGVDLERIRWFGILQRIAIGYLFAALCEIWLSRPVHQGLGIVKRYHLHWLFVVFLSVVFCGLSYGLYVQDWQFEQPLSSPSMPTNNNSVYSVKCSVRGDLGPACNAAGMIDRYVIGINHLYKKPVYRNLEDCNISSSGEVPELSPSWCHAPFDPEGILGSLMAAVTCIIGLQYGHVLASLQDHRKRLHYWSLLSVPLLVLGIFLAIVGIPVNKSLYTVSYTLITSSAAGLTFCALYLLVDSCGYRQFTGILEWMGKHSLAIFILVTSNVAVVLIQGFYWKTPQNNIIHWIVALAKSA
ncbi:hypothetical protein MLD38_013871 [Melastoma candidum]|uniref:Uncharacterized protein n=1 Tax=Melastoma candidum TaxID=119954 RepID=A0ACB9RAK9_9MYRT|nr:hypothetical protein MLD38_013871 [Melastoma candidum]